MTNSPNRQESAERPLPGVTIRGAPCPEGEAGQCPCAIWQVLPTSRELSSVRYKDWAFARSLIDFNRL
jgi:hypothetical protein